MEKVGSIDEYLSNIESEAHRLALEHIRSLIQEGVPDATEAISYAMPAFRLRGPFIWFAAFKNHCSLFAGYTVADFADELIDFRTSKGTIQFQPDKPIPDDLVRRIVRKRADENRSKKRK
ncbi:MAG: iron chaperone [Fimbriimonas sp.]